MKPVCSLYLLNLFVPCHYAYLLFADYIVNWLKVLLPVVVMSSPYASGVVLSLIVAFQKRGA